MADLRACIIGLGETGTSLGLALKRARAPFHVTGHDKDRQRMGLAQRLKAVDKTFWNVHRAVENADLVILAVPLSELPALLPLLQDTFKPRSLVLLLANTLQPVLELAQAHVPSTVSYVLGHPILTGIKAPVTERDDLFQDALFCLIPGPATSAEAMRVAHNLIEHLGAQPHYLDAPEHDGLIAGVEHLAYVLAGAYMNAAANGTGWHDARKVAGRVFYHATDIDSGPAQLSASLLANRAYVLTWLGIMQQELAAWHRILQEGDGETLEHLAASVHAARAEWEKRAALQDWSEAAQPSEATTSAGMMRQMFLGSWGARRRALPNSDDRSSPS